MGMRIATPVCGLVRNDIVLFEYFRWNHPLEPETFQRISGDAAGGFSRGRLFGSAP